MKLRLHVPMEELLNRTNSMYKLVILASKRALELNEGSPKLVETDAKKVTSVALEEIRRGKISIKHKKKEK
ncbi:MAG: DNA-directed RNA polymerase subunit omega [Candidatus Omnitrophota bacterium]